MSEIIAAPKADSDDDDEEEEEEEKEETKAEASSSSSKKKRSDLGKERNKINKLQFAKGIRRIKVNTKWMILDPKVLLCICLLINNCCRRIFLPRSPLPCLMDGER